MDTEIIRFLSVSVLPILVLGIGYIILKSERKKRIDTTQNNDQDHNSK